MFRYFQLSSYTSREKKKIYINVEKVMNGLNVTFLLLTILTGFKKLTGIKTSLEH